MAEPADDVGKVQLSPERHELSPTGQAAVDYAIAGHPVFPVYGIADGGACRCEDGARCRNPGKHPLGRLVPHGLDDATDDVATVEGWWRAAPDANVAIATGKTIVVVDGDRKTTADGQRIDGVASFLQLAAQRGALPETACADTGGGGAHFCFAADPDAPVRNQQAMLVDGKHLLGVDVRGLGGYIVAPPSLHASGRRYTWARPLERLQPAPPWLLQILAAGAAVPVSRDSRGEVVARSLDPELEHRIRAALGFCSPSTDRTTWIERVSMPIHDAYGGSEVGFALWHEWCQKGRGSLTPNGNPAYGGEAECRRIWRSFSAGHRNPKGLATLFAFARELGWLDQAAPAASQNGHAGGAPAAARPQFEPDEIAEALSECRNPGPFPVSLALGLEGPLGSAVHWILGCARRPDPVLALGAALAFVAAAIGRRFVGPMGTRPMLAIAVLAPSGAGKERPHECLTHLVLGHPNLLVGYLDDTPTHRAQVDELLLKSKGQVLMALDEYGAAVRRWLSPRDVSASSMSPTIRRLVAHGGGVYKLAPVSQRHPARAANKEAWDAGVWAPAVSLVGYATPGQFYEALSESSLVDGLLGRHIVLASDSPEALRAPELDPQEFPGHIEEWIRSVESVPIPALARGLLADQPAPSQAEPSWVAPRDPVEIPWAGDSPKQAWEALSREIDQAAHEAIRQGDEPRTAVLRRLPGQTMVLAFVLAVGESLPARHAAIELRHVELGYRIARWSADHLAHRLRHGVSHEPLAQAHDRLCQIIERRSPKPTYRSVVARKLWLSSWIDRAWKLVEADPRFFATPKWARLRTEQD